jgi:hypothetical protein
MDAQRSGVFSDSGAAMQRSHMQRGIDSELRSVFESLSQQIANNDLSRQSRRELLALAS